MLKNHLSALLTALVIVIPISGAYLLEVPQPAVLGLFITIVVLWVTELLPLPVTGLLVPVMASLFGLLPKNEAFSAFGNEILFLFLGCFLLAVAMEKHGLSRRIALTILAIPIASRSVNSIAVSLAVVCWLVGMWVSSTATCAMMVPIALGIYRALEPDIPDGEQRSRYATRLLLTCAFVPNVGGISTPVSTPPNILAFGLLEEAGISISFTQWFAIAFPLSFVLLVGVILLFGWLFPVDAQYSRKDYGVYFREQLRILGPITRAESQVFWVFIAMVFFWVVPEYVGRFLGGYPMANTIAGHLSLSNVAVASACLLFLLPAEKTRNLTPSDLNLVPWGTLLLFGGGLCLGHVLTVSGAGAQLMSLLLSQSQNGIWVTAVIGIAITVLLSEFASNTAAASIVVPLLLSTPEIAQHPSALPLILAITFSAGFGFMFPISTPPNAIVYGTGEVPGRFMMKAGLFFDLYGIFCILVFVILRYYLLGGLA